MPQITPEEMKAYKRTARARWQSEQKQLADRRDKAWKLANQAARLLKEQFGVQRVAAFGSLTHPDRFTRWSDVDLAAWGLTSDNWLKAIGAVNSLSREIELNLVDVTTVSPELYAVIEKEGVDL
jgi:predicted nucleotidyltransferase